MKIGIIAAMEEEVKTLVEKLTDQKKKEIANQTFYDGKINHNEVTLVQSGIGKVNASIAATLLIELFDVEAVINTGSAGGIGVGLSIGDLVVSRELTYNDADARAFGYEYGQIPQMPEKYIADEHLIDTFSKTAEKLNWNVHQGLIVTGDSFISSERQINHIIDHFPDALVTEMEGTAIAQTCHQFNIPYIVVRALSDTADEVASVSFDQFIDEAGKQSADLVLHFLDRLTL